MQKVKKITILVLSIVSLLLLGAVVISRLELRASNILLEKWAAVQPGTNISTINKHLGESVREITTIKDMKDFGSIKDPNFLRDKKLFWFYASTPPCRVLEVYTDTNNVVVYTSWHGL